MTPNHKRNHTMPAMMYGSIPTVDYTIDEEQPQTNFGGGIHFGEHMLSEGFSPLIRTMSTKMENIVIGAEAVMEEKFVPLIRTVSEGVQTLANPSFVLNEKALDPHEDRRKHFSARAGTSSIPSEIANLSKNTIGGGVMSLSGGIAIFANDPDAVIYAVCWILVLGFLFGYFCLL